MGSRASTPFRDPAALAVSALAVYRLTRLVVEDTIAAPIRDRIVDRADPMGDPNRPRLDEFLSCPWCVSVWAAAAWAGLTVAAPAVAAPVGAVLAWSAVSGLLSSLE